MNSARPPARRRRSRSASVGGIGPESRGPGRGGRRADEVVVKRPEDRGECGECTRVDVIQEEAADRRHVEARRLPQQRQAAAVIRTLITRPSTASRRRSTRPFETRRWILYVRTLGSTARVAAMSPIRRCSPPGPPSCMSTPKSTWVLPQSRRSSASSCVSSAPEYTRYGHQAASSGRPGSDGGHQGARPPRHRGRPDAGRQPREHRPLHRLRRDRPAVGQGNFVATLCKARWEGAPYAQADLFRVEDGLVVEHCQNFPELAHSDAGAIASAASQRGRRVPGRRSLSRIRKPPTDLADQLAARACGSPRIRGTGCDRHVPRCP